MTALNWFDGVVGYHICLTHRRSPVRARVESSLFSPPGRISNTVLFYLTHRLVQLSGNLPRQTGDRLAKSRALLTTVPRYGAYEDRYPSPSVYISGIAVHTTYMILVDALPGGVVSQLTDVCMYANRCISKLVRLLGDCPRLSGIL